MNATLSALRPPCVVLALFLLTSSFGLADEDEEPVVAPRPGAGASADAAAGTGKELPWLDTLARGYVEAQRQGRPIFVRAGGESCPWCRVLEREIREGDAQQELARWTRVAVDVDASPDDARVLTVGPIPALRLLTPGGKLVASHEGALPADELVAWLRSHHDEAAVVPPQSLAADGPPKSGDVAELVAQFAQRDAVLREAAVQRLLPYPQVAAPDVVSAFEGGPLAVRLAALELLREWAAPVDEIDPWRPETVSKDRLDALAGWASTLGEAAPERPAELTADDLASARQAIATMLAADPTEARAIRERLARLGGALLPEVYARLQTSATDAARERLTALRYRLVATPALALGWPGGLERLAATDLATRQQAADELARRATAADEPLLLELFSDPAPLVREISLRALKRVGSSGADSALVRLLDDPAPNVRAAVLKQLAEEPPPGIVPRIAEYVAREPDHDLVVHAVRLLRAAKGRPAFEALQPLLSHESWRVRAEAATGLGETINRNNYGHSEDARVTPAEGDRVLIEVLKDPDGFVVSRAVESMRQTSLADAIDPLAEAALTHPDLARGVVEIFASHTLPQDRVLPHLHKFAEHETPLVRAAAVGGLTQLLADEAQEPLRAALHDEAAEVRIAAADAFFEMLELNRPSTADETQGDFGEAIPSVTVIHDGGRVIEFPAEAAPPPRRGLLGGLFDLFGGSEPQPPAPVARPEPMIADAGPAADRSADPDAPVEAPIPESVETKTDRLLKQIRRREVFGEWQHQFAERLMTMLAAETAEERLAAALPVAALGRDEQAVPALAAVLQSHPRMLPKIAQALPWLLWSDRKALFDRLADAAADPDELGIVARSMAEIPEDRAAAGLWGLLGRPEIGALAAHEVHEAFLSFYFAIRSWDPSNAAPTQKAKAAAAAAARAKSGPRWQRIAALSLLLWTDREAARSAAQAIFGDPAADPVLRADAFQVLLLAGTLSPSTAEAVAALTSDLPEIRGRALTYLALGADSLMSLESGRFELINGNADLPGAVRNATSGEVIVPEPPHGLTPEPLLPLLRSGDPREAALAAYLLVLLDRPEELPALIGYWRAHAPQDPEWTRLVYRAVAFVDDSRHVPVLREIYESIARQRYPNYDEFYWTIRIMTGPEALALRKRIRDEVGMDQLR